MKWGVLRLRQLEYFVAIAAAGSLRGASERLNVAQPALSRHLRELESELGTRLCDRTSRGVSLTQEGMRLLERATVVLREVDAIKTHIHSDNTGLVGDVVFSAPPEIARILFAPISAAVHREHPGIRLGLLEARSYGLLAALDAGRADIGIIISRDFRAKFMLEPVLPERVFLIGTHWDEKFPERPVEMADLSRFPMFLMAGTEGIRQRYEEAARIAGVTLHVVQELGSALVIRDFVQRGLGYSMVPYSAAVRDVRSGLYDAVEIRGLTLSRTLVLRERSGARPEIGAVLDIVRRTMKDLTEQGEFDNGHPIKGGMQRRVAVL